MYTGLTLEHIDGTAAPAIKKCSVLYQLLLHKYNRITATLTTKIV